MKKPEPEEIPFMDDLEAQNYADPPAVSGIFLYTVCTLVIVLYIWASVSTVDEITRGSGEVVPSSHAQIVQSLEGGILDDLLIKEGDIVKKGQVLMRLSEVAFASEERSAEARVAALTLRKIRLEAESKGQEFIIPEELKDRAKKIAANEMDLYQSRQKEYRNALDIIDNQIVSIASQIHENESQMSKNSYNSSLIKKELAITSKMVAQKAIPQIEELRLQRELSDANGAYSIARDKKAGLEAELNGAKKQKEDQADKFRTQSLGELNETEIKLADLEQSLKTIGDRVDRREIRSPVEGVVNNIAIRTVGGVVEPAMKLAEIIPVDEELKIQARILPSDVAFLKVGLPARVKLTSYDAARYGYLDGEVTRVGASSITSKDGNIYFEIEVKTSRNHLGDSSHPLPITPGMVAEVNVITGKKSILEYLMKPFLRMKDRAFTER
ncbi:MAG: HlyD family type I secretion periplasmic adaptor subunit [Alphaproteobacteria bacterium]|jgi:adhesin transport system membrane fusion protein|nr:HlyD family type I secretion periplasmic adaptor subunit [Alphaproteobacteria bacterium]MCB1551199.1 HlyD family type I secretion periplasmic adaptor subunit [Alphaproteobacteria bacterium]MCB9985923.1 HlyD family type I secretion periplasmic adaptor subunit [Micavibrio sp.]HRK96923.1 HlyD family type I secretion periplasmic adaptor subunit [Alphaproteobacteria bacterium]